MLVTVAGCGKAEKQLKITEDEALEVLKELVPASYEINVMFFGEGLPTTDEQEYEDTSYVPVDTGKSRFSSIVSMKVAAEKVFSQNYLSNVYVVMFEGTKSTDSDGLLDNNMSPRYKEIASELCIDASYKPYNILGKLYVESVKIVKRTADYVSVDALCTDEDGNEINKRFFLTLDYGEWRLDGPTY
jgi:hypothetical protein